jgi:hypothetical protein
MSLFRKIWRYILIKYLLEDPETCEHEWVVYSTCLQDSSLDVQCNKCAILGSVPNPSKEEWSKAYDAPSNPYPWTENERVKVGTVRLI